MIRQRQVLVLNADFTILSISSLHRILGMYINHKINIVKVSGDKKIHPSLSFDGIPSIVSLKKYVYIPYREINITRKRVFQRDRYRCQYCNKKLTNSTATIDHIIPRSQRDSPGNIWQNMVASCVKCNNIKGDMSLKDSGLQLRRKPFTPKFEHFFRIKDEWRDFINLDEDEIMAVSANE